MKLLKENLKPAEISSLRKQLSSSTLTDFDKKILLSKLEEKIEKSLLQQGKETGSVRMLGFLFRELIVFEIELNYARQTHSITIYVLCRTAEGVPNFRKAVDTGIMRKLLADAVMEHLGDSMDVVVQLRVNNEALEMATTIFQWTPGEFAFACSGFN